MKSFWLIAALLLATGSGPAQSQLGQTLPQRAEIKDASGQVVATATTWGTQTVYRNAEGELTGSSKIADGKMTFYDPNGKITRVVTQENRTFTHRNATGEVLFTVTLDKDGAVIYRDATGNVLNK